MIYTIILVSAFLSYLYAVLWSFFGTPYRKNTKVAGGLLATIILCLIDVILMVLT
jgi:hypothetical protein